MSECRKLRSNVDKMSLRHLRAEYLANRDADLMTRCFISLL